MPSITIRDVPSETRDRLAARAAATGRSLQEYLLAELNDLADKPDKVEFLADLREHKRRLGTEVSAAQVLSWLDTDRKWAELE